MDNEESFSMKKLQICYEKFTDDVTFTNLTGVQMLYRRSPVPWVKLRYLAMPCPKAVTLGRVGITEHNFTGLCTENDIVENDRYNRILLRNIKFGLFMRMMELSRSVTGFSKNPLTNGACREWADSWEFLTETTTDLAQWTKTVAFHVNLDISKFFSTVHASITTYVKDMKLRDTDHWRAIGEELTLIDHLKNWIALLQNSYNLQHNAYLKLWYHHIRLQGDFCKLAMQVVKK